MTLISIPKQHYVNTRGQNTDDDFPLGFLTPYEDNAAFKKRKQTVDAWACGHCYGNKSEAQREGNYINNELMEGFQISKHVKRYGWNGGNVVWRITDPRGFELEIQSANFASIVACTTIINGVIQGKCIWGREGAQNVLLPELSEPYQLAVEQTKRNDVLKTNKITAKDVKVGDIIEIKDGSHVEFLGLFHYIYHDVDSKYSYHQRESTYTYDNIGKRYVFKVVKSAENEYDDVGRIISSSKVEGVRFIQRLETAKDINDNLEMLRRLSRNPINYSIWYMSTKPLKAENIKTKKIDFDKEVDIIATVKRYHSTTRTESREDKTRMICKTSHGMFLLSCSSRPHDKTERFWYSLVVEGGMDDNGVKLKIENRGNPPSQMTLKDGEYYQIQFTYDE